MGPTGEILELNIIHIMQVKCLCLLLTTKGLANVSRRTVQNLVKSYNEEILILPAFTQWDFETVFNFNFDNDAELALQHLSLIVPQPISKTIMDGPISSTKNLTLIVDMDQTLLDCQFGSRLNNAIVFREYSCFLRPHWKEFLIRASKDYELVLWSAGKKYSY
jgi:hypothetical protein